MSKYRLSMRDDLDRVNTVGFDQQPTLREVRETVVNWVKDMGAYDSEQVRVDFNLVSPEGDDLEADQMWVNLI